LFPYNKIRTRLIKLPMVSKNVVRVDVVRYPSTFQ